MGLDMYAVALPSDQVTGMTDIPVDDIEDTRDLHYWRKHTALHTWMEQLYIAKGGAEGDFNGASVVLDLDDLDRLEAAVRSGDLRRRDGEVTDGADSSDDFAFIKAARDAIAAGLSVAYFGSW